MGRVLAVLVGWWCAGVMATSTNQELIHHLGQRMQQLPHTDGHLIKSFTNHSQSYIYDQALAIISFTKANEKNKARLLLLGLSSLQMKDGSLYFSYYLDGKSPYPKEGDKRFAGAIAWVAMAASQYQHQFRDKEFVNFNRKILTYLSSQMASLKVNGQNLKAIKFAPHNLSSTSWNEAETVALEHNLDAYAAYQQFTRLNKQTDFHQSTIELKKFVLSMWDKTRSHFWSGANTKTGEINKSELYLDNQSWSLLALDRESLREIKPKEALELNCETLYVEHENVKGFMDSKPTRRPASSKFVWSEGTLGQILAMKKVGATCHNQSAEHLLLSIAQMKDHSGGVAYATKTSNPDFTTASSVAGTAWLYFAANGINPFSL